MPITPTYPGVYIEEIPSGVRTIVGVSTSVTGFVGYFTRGPLNTPVQIFNPGDYEREFGGLRRDDETGHAIQQYFLNGGSNAQIVRVASGLPTAAAVTMQGPTAAPAITASAGREVRGESVEDPGEWGNNIRLQVDYDTEPADATHYNLRVSEVATVGGRQVILRSETFANLSVTATDIAYGIPVVNEGSKLVQLVEAGALLRPAQTGTTGVTPAGAALFDDASSLTANIASLGFSASFELTGLNSTLFTGNPRGVARALARGLQGLGRAQNPVVDALAGARVNVQGDHLRVLLGGEDSSAIITFTENGASVAADLGIDVAATANVQEYSLNGAAGLQQTPIPGTNGGLPDADALVGDFGDKTGIFALRDVDLFNLLCIPGAVAPGVNSATVYATAETFCEEERAFLLVDMPTTINEFQEAIDFIDDANIRHRNAAAYFPRLRIPDPTDGGRLRPVAPSGTMAGIYARTDGERGVWKAPAGLDAVLRNAQGLATVLTDAENGQINPVGINGLRRFPVYGRVAWGARTLVGADVQASEWKYVPVRRLALFLEESLFRGLQWVVFEPNDEPLWSQMRLNAGAFMHDLFRKGAFQGTSPKDAYFVKCDNETTTQNDINAGIVNIVVGFAPLKPAEFVIIKIQQIAGNIET